MGCLSKKVQYPSTGSPTYQNFKVTNANHRSMMKTGLTIIPMCPRELFSHYKKLSRIVLSYKKDWATLLHLIYFYYLLLVTNYLITKLSVTDNVTPQDRSFRCLPGFPRFVVWFVSSVALSLLACPALHIMSSCAFHLHTCSSHASEHFPRCPFCIPALLCPPVVLSTSFRVWELNISRLDQDL